MTSLHKDIAIHAPAASVWDAVRDFGRPHERITPGVLTDSTFDGSVRTVTFANGFAVSERLVDLDDDAMRVAYTVVDGPFEHHHATMLVVAVGPTTSRLEWTTDLLPDDVAPMVAELVEAGSKAMQQTLGAVRPALRD
jgi:hypothetical protein